MESQVQNGSIPSRGRSPHLPSRLNDDSRPKSPRMNSDSLLPPVTIRGRRDPSANGSAENAADYWNGGSPHLSLSPMDSGEPSPRQTSPMPTRRHQEPDQLAGDISKLQQKDQDAPESYAGRRSVQFARTDALETPYSHSRHGSWDGTDSPGRSRSAALMSRIKAFAGPSSGPSSPRSPNMPMRSSELATQSMTNSPTALRASQTASGVLAEEQSDQDADADVEETADESSMPLPSSEKKKKKRMRRPKKGHMASPSFSRFSQGGDSLATYNRLLRRRASMPDTSARSGLSEDELPTRPGASVFRRQHSWVHASRSHGEEPDDVDSPTVGGRRTRHMRRITVLGGGGISDGDAVTQRRPFFKSERASSYGANKWRRVKDTLKLLRQKKEDRFDYFKSAELMAELRAGAPAVLMFASMIQRDEHGNRRIPVLLEQLKLRVTDSAPVPDDDKERHWIFTMELEYGSGPSRMSWTVTRTIREIYNLHLRYKLKINNEKYMHKRMELGARLKQPKFPYSAFPYLRNARDKGDSSDEDDNASVQPDDATGDGVVGGNILSEVDEAEPTPRRRRSRGTVLGIRRQSTGLTDPGEDADNQSVDLAARRLRYVEKQRRTVEKYLSEMVRWLMFRVDSNRLCRFLELSALGVRLAAEGSYHGKEGYLHIQSSKGLDFRRVLTPAKVISRHSRKWFLVRQSYIVCVESPENMNIYDVYLVDSDFKISSKKSTLKQIGSGKDEIDLTVEAPPEKHHTLMLHTSERKVRLFARYQSAMKQFEESINEMLRLTPWYQKKRFDSFAPVRTGVFAQWLVDGRDYMWNVSRAINMAKDVIYIHDWWLSPELYMRRPACISQKWRLDRLLQKKAKEGVKIFIIIYRNVEAAIPIDSEYTKFSLLNLHPNIFVQRSPNQFKKNQFFFAHHEKICVVDHDVAFVGGIDLCFGRWDCPQHPIVDDRPTGFEMSETPKDAEHCQLFPGKDYSNPRVQDFFRLNEPYEEMYDRTRVPRMPWHDVSMQVVGQPARDLTRHFVQRWNYLRRGRRPTRPLPFLLPPPDAKVEELEALGLTGSCEVQILRSATTWSLGIDNTEHSIQTAYVKMIEDSEHFVYIENQFFITSTDFNNTRITNRIGDALVERIIRAYENDEDWRCAVVIPLMPGFQNTVDEQEGTSVRLILMCQFKSICRGEHSIFGRLKAEGIDPEDYINFYSLRQWGIMSNDVLVTEQLYIHAKTIIVDDRVALIGSANINERSMLGTRDSECAAIVRDTDMIWSTMAGKPYKVARFAHTLRLRLMREHLGLDVDEILEQEREEEFGQGTFEQTMDEIYGATSASPSMPGPSSQHLDPQPQKPHLTHLPSFNHDLDLDRARALDSDTSLGKGDPAEVDERVTNNPKHQLDLSGYGDDHWRNAKKTGLDEGRDSVVVNGREVLVHNIDNEGKGTLDVPKSDESLSRIQEVYARENHAEHADKLPPMAAFNRRTTEQMGFPRVAQLTPLPVIDDTDIGGPPVHLDADTGEPTSGAFHPMAADITMAYIDKDCMRDPVNSSFFDDVWNRAAQNNTKLYRRVFRCMPDSEVSTWAEYREYTDYSERFRASMETRSKSSDLDGKADAHGRGSTAAGAAVSAPGPDAILKAVEHEVEGLSEKIAERMPGHGNGSHKPKVIIPESGEEEVNEKQAFPDYGEAHGYATSKPGKLDTSITGDHQRALEDPSPVYSHGDVPFPELEKPSTKYLDPQTTQERERRTTFSTTDKPASRDASIATSMPAGQFGSVRRRRRATTKGSRRAAFSIDDMPSRSDAEELLKMIQGNIVQFPYDWLLTEEHNGNWSYQVDGVAPLAIYD